MVTSLITCVSALPRGFTDLIKKPYTYIIILAFLFLKFNLSSPFFRGLAGIFPHRQGNFCSHIAQNISRCAGFVPLRFADLTKQKTGYRAGLILAKISSKPLTVGSVSFIIRSRFCLFAIFFLYSLGSELMYFLSCKNP